MRRIGFVPSCRVVSSPVDKIPNDLSSTPPESLTLPSSSFLPSFLQIYMTTAAAAAAKLDLNLRPTIAPKASEWCQKRMEGVVGGNHRTLLLEDIACLKEELQKIEPFSRDLSSIIPVVTYVTERLEEEVVPWKDDMDGDVSDLSSDVEEDGRGKTVSQDDHGDKKKSGLDSNDLWRGGYNMETDTKTDSTVSNKGKQQEIADKESSVLSPTPLHQSTVEAQVMFDHRSFGSHDPDNGMVAKQQPPPRKRRRCWSHELHGRFVDVLEKLGGPQGSPAVRCI